MTIKLKAPLFAIFIISLSLSSLAQEDIQTTNTDSIRELKEQILDRKLQLQLVTSLIKREKLDTQYPQLNLKFQNKMSSRYLLHTLEYYIDDSKVFSFYNDLEKLEKKDQANAVEVEKFQLSISPGTHNLRVVAVYTGNDTGVFSYLSDYKVRSEASFPLEVEKAKGQDLNIVGFEKGNIFTDFKERPGIEISRN